MCDYLTQWGERKVEVEHMFIVTCNVMGRHRKCSGSEHSWNWIS